MLQAKLKYEAYINNILQMVEPHLAEPLKKDRQGLIHQEETMRFDFKNTKAICEVALSRDLSFEAEEAFKKILGIVRKYDY